MSEPFSDSIVIAPFVHTSACPEELNNSIWSNVPRILIGHYWSGNPAPVERHAKAQLCWNDESLNVRFVCQQHEPLVIASNPITNRKTLLLWERDVCEIFIAPDPLNPRHYFEFEAAPTGEWVDLDIQITPAGKDTTWNFESGMSVAVEIGDTSVTIGMKIPWSRSIPRPEAGDEWLVNLFRCIGPESESRYLAWRPTRTPEPNFHVPQAFGRLCFK